MNLASNIMVLWIHFPIFPFAIIYHLRVAQWSPYELNGCRGMK